MPLNQSQLEVAMIFDNTRRTVRRLQFRAARNVLVAGLIAGTLFVGTQPLMSKQHALDSVQVAAAPAVLSPAISPARRSGGHASKEAHIARQYGELRQRLAASSDQSSSATARPFFR
jgi:hypothetical protein